MTFARRLIAIGALGCGAVGAAHVACGSPFPEQAPTTAPDAATPPVIEPDDPDGAADAAASPFCASHRDAVVCADFDEGAPVSFLFTEAQGDVTVDVGLSRSAPGSMRAFAGPTQAYLRREVTASGFTAKQRLSFDTFLGSPGQPVVDAVVSRMQQGAFGCVFDLVSFKGGARFEVAVPGDGGVITREVADLTAYPPPKTWVRVAMLLEGGSTDGTVGVKVTIVIDGVLALAARPTNCPALTTTPLMQLGVIGPPFLNPSGEAHFDNVLVESR